MEEHINSSDPFNPLTLSYKQLGQAMLDATQQSVAKSDNPDRVTATEDTQKAIDVSEERYRVYQLYNYYCAIKQQLRQDILKDQEDIEFIKTTINSRTHEANSMSRKLQSSQLEDRVTRLDNIIALKNKSYNIYEYHTKLAMEYSQKETLKDFHTVMADERKKIMDEVNPYIATKVVQLCSLIKLANNTQNAEVAREILRDKFAEWKKHILKDIEMIENDSDLVQALANTNLREELLEVKYARNNFVTTKK